MFYDYLKLVRFPNLVIVAATQYFIRWLVIFPMININHLEFQFSSLDFFLLVLATVCITAAGYVINDYFDTKTDILNRPEKVIVGKTISRRHAIALHSTLSIVGVLLGFYVSYRIELPVLGVIFLMASGILWFYSTTYKRQFLVGNFIVAIMTALVPFIVVIYEIPPLNKEYGEILLRQHVNFNYIIAWVGGFSLFAFLLTLIREIVKDAEDFEGDKAFGRNTLPIVMGIKFTKTVTYVLVAVTIAGLGLIYIIFLKDLISIVYLILTVILPLLYSTLLIRKAETPIDYHKISTILKFIMLFGVLYALVINFIINSKF